MREYKFRGKARTGWKFGSFWAPSNEACKPLIYERFAIPMRDGNGYWHEVDADTVGQFTGLKDLAGNEIYEGDVIKTREGDVGVIVWETELGGFRARLTDDSFYTLTAFFASMFSVIGNIYDNSDLLEAHV